MWNAKYSNSSHPYANSALHQTWIFTSGQSPDWVVTLIALPMLRPEQLLSGEECLAWQISLQVLSPIKLQKKKFMGNCKGGGAGTVRQFSHGGAEQGALCNLFQPVCGARAVAFMQTPFDKGEMGAEDLRQV